MNLYGWQIKLAKLLTVMTEGRCDETISFPCWGFPRQSKDLSKTKQWYYHSVTHWTSPCLLWSKVFIVIRCPASIYFGIPDWNSLKWPNSDVCNSLSTSLIGMHPLWNLVNSWYNYIFFSVYFPLLSNSNICSVQSFSTQQDW